MDDVCCRVLTSGSTGAPHPVGAHLRQLPLERGRLRPSTSASSPSDRWLCCLPLSHISGLGIVMRSVIYGTTAVVHDGFDVDRVAAALRARRDHRRLAGGDDADPAARGRRRPLRPAGDPGRRRPGARGAAGRGDRQGRHRGPDLRPDRDLLAGDDAGPGRRAAQARLRRPAAADHPPADPATARSSSRARPSPPAAPTPTAGCTPATSATSTRRASSTSRTGSTT